MRARLSQVAMALCVAGILVEAVPARAQNPGTWEALGPTDLGGPVLAISPDPRNTTSILIGTQGGVWRTTDGGLTWEDTGAPARWITALARRPGHPDTVIAATDGDGLYRTDDNGLTWSAIAAAREVALRTLQLTWSADGQTILALRETSIDTPIIRSGDAGLTWATAQSGIFVQDLAFSAADPLVAVAASRSSSLGGTLRSADGGLTWTSTEGADTGSRLAWSRSAPATVYLLDDGAETHRLAMSTDGGLTFTTVSEVAVPSTTPAELWVDTTDADTILIGAQDLWRSTDGGLTFTRISNAQEVASARGPVRTIVAATGYDVSNPRVSVGTDAGFFTTADVLAPGVAWELRVEGLAIASFRSAAAPPDGGYVVALTQNGEIFRYASRTWSRVFTPPDGPEGDRAGARPVLVDPQNPSYVYAVGGSALLRSVDGGQTFAAVPGSPAPSSVVLDASRPTTVVVASNGDVWRTLNARDAVPEWTKIHDSQVGPGGTPEGAMAVRRLWINPLDGGLWATALTRFPKSFTHFDRAVDLYASSLTFSAISGGHGDSLMAQVAFSASSTDVSVLQEVFSLPPNLVQHIFRTNASGTSLAFVSTIGPPLETARDIAIHPKDPAWQFLATDNGVYESRDRGVTWTRNSPAEVRVDELLWLGHRLIAVTRGRGLYALTFGSNGVLAIDTPAAGRVRQPFAIAGWALDFSAASTTGVEAVDVYAVPQAGGVTVHLGAATYGLARRDVAAAFGAHFTDTGFHLTARGLAAGDYQILVTGRSTFTGESFSASRHVTVEATTLMSVDTPASGTSTTQPLVIAGWAADFGAASGTGVDAIHVWAYPADGTAPRFVGTAGYGGARGDVGAAFGAQFAHSGFGLTVRSLPPGTYTIVVYARSTLTRTFNAARVVVVNVLSSTYAHIDTPRSGEVLTPLRIAGWAIDRASADGPGVDAVHVWGIPAGGTAVFLGSAAYGGARADVGAAFGAQFTNSSYSLTLGSLAPGTWDLLVFPHSTLTGQFGAASVVRVTVASAPVAASVARKSRIRR